MTNAIKTNPVQIKPTPFLGFEDLENDFEKRKEITTGDKLVQSLLDPFEVIAEENPVLLINGVGAGTKGNICTVIGKAKSKKSMFLSMWVSTLLGEANVKGFVSGLGAVKGIYFDTEQSKRHAQLQYKRIGKLLDINLCKGLSYYVLRPYSPLERLKMIEQAIYEADDITFVIIDGIADLLSKGVNDEEEAISITNLLMKWSLERNIHISTVLHQNKGNSDAKGHIGSYLMQKSETVLSIEKDTNDKEVSIVTSPYARGMEIDEIFFSVDDNGVPFIVENFQSGKEKPKSKSPRDYEVDINRRIIQEVFKNNSGLLLRELNETIRYVLAKYSINIGEKKCRDWITYFKEEEMILQSGNNKPYTLNKAW